MASYKLSFRFERQNYSQEIRVADNDRLKLKLKKLAEDKHITIAFMHTPSRKSIKIIFNDEYELNKILLHKDYFKSAGFYPTISKTLKTRRTVFCSGFDSALLQTYSKDDIRDHLEKDDWNVTGIYIMKNNRSFKIEFHTTHQATQFLEYSNTNIGGIKLHQRHKEREINTTIDQCWDCGLLYRDHTSQNCQGPQICMYCGSTTHKFYNCPIPRKLDNMTPRQKSIRYCAPCDTTGDHTSLDHSLCPKKKEIIQERIRVGREKREHDIQSDAKDINLIKKFVDMTHNETWPNLKINKQQTQLTTLITLAIIDEAFNPGLFQDKLNESCISNGVIPVKYTLEPNTAKEFIKTLSGAGGIDSIQKTQTPTMHISDYCKLQTPPLHISKYSKDQLGGKKYKSNLENFELYAGQNRQEIPVPTQTKFNLKPETSFNGTTDLNETSFDRTLNLSQYKADLSQDDAIRRYLNQKPMTESSDISDDDSHASIDSYEISKQMLYKSGTHLQITTGIKCDTKKDSFAYSDNSDCLM